MTPAPHPPLVARRFAFALLWSVALALPSFAAEPAVYLAVGRGGHRMFSADGWTWDRHAEWGAPGQDNNDLNVAVNFKGSFFAGGGFDHARLCATRDGVTWSDGQIPRGSPIFGLEVVGEELWAVCLKGEFFKTKDGASWELVGKAAMPTPQHWIRKSAYGNGLIGACGDFGAAAFCDLKTGRITVTQMAGQTEKKANLKRIAFGNDLFVVCGQNGLLAATRDGVTWQNNEPHPTRGPDMYSVVWTGTMFLAPTRNETCWYSTDGLHWESRTPPLVPTQLRVAGPGAEWIFGYDWPPSKFGRIKDGLRVKYVPNEKQWSADAFAYGPLAGGEPPRLPQPSAGEK